MIDNTTSLPIDVRYPERVLQADGTMFVTLNSLDDLSDFWAAHKDQFAFACNGGGHSDPIFIGDHEWIFGSSKAAVVKSVMRWEQMGVTCEFYDCAKHDPAIMRSFFKDRDEHRLSQIEKHLWFSKDEAAYRADCIRRSPDNYRGWWRLKNLPKGYDPEDWFDCLGGVEVFDPSLSLDAVSLILQEKTFDEWKLSDCGEITFHDRASLERLIKCSMEERGLGITDYYGSEA